MPKTDVKAAYTRSHGYEARHRKQSYNKERKKQFSAGCLIPVLEEDTVYMLEYQGNVGGWE